MLRNGARFSPRPETPCSVDFLTPPVHPHLPNRLDSFSSNNECDNKHESIHEISDVPGQILELTDHQERDFVLIFSLLIIE